ncbi:MAG: hypothetical protein RL757_2466 [Bacteroidota bacterium]|jgi:hypothetical protein
MLSLTTNFKTFFFTSTLVCPGHMNGEALNKLTF